MAIKSKANIPETTLFFCKIDFNIFAVCYTELYAYKVPRVIPLGCCWLPVKKDKGYQHKSKVLSLKRHTETPCRFKEQL